MYCPDCGAEYREGITACADCGIPLVAQPPAKTRYDPEEFDEILETYNPGDIAMIRSLLDAAGIDYYIFDENFNNIRPLVEPARLFVARSQEEQAREILRDLDLSYRGINPPGKRGRGREEDD